MTSITIDQAAVDLEFLERQPSWPCSCYGATALRRGTMAAVMGVKKCSISVKLVPVLRKVCVFMKDLMTIKHFFSTITRHHGTWSEKSGTSLMIRMRACFFCVLTLGKVALRESIGDVWELAPVVAIFQRAHVHVAPLLQLLEPTALLFALTVGVQHHTHPQCT